MKRRLIIFGGKTAVEILAVAEEVHGSDFDRIECCYFSPEATFEAQGSALRLVAGEDACYIIGVIEWSLRNRIEHFAAQFQLRPFSIVHPSAYVASSAIIGAGCFLAPQCVVAVNATVGDHCLVHFHSSIGHHAVMGRHCAILPGARISGEVRLGDGVLVGSNAFVFQKTNIGDRVQIDALTYVKEDLPANRTVSVRRGVSG